MRKAYLYEAIFLVNQGIDQAVRGLERLKRGSDSGLSPEYFDEKLVLFEEHRGSLNACFCNNVESAEHQRAARFEKRYREYQKQTLREVKVYQDVRAVEENRRKRGDAPVVRFLNAEERVEWKRQYPKPAESSDGAAPEENGHA